ncbi:MAG TPA: transglycosylase domain-containing protein [Thermoanaerobaculia bacterium]
MDYSPRLPSRHIVFRTIGIVFGIFVVAFLVLGIYVYKQSIGKFELRRLSLPTRVFADAVPLHAGVAMSSDDLLTKLDRLGYREAKKGVAQPGDFARGGNQIDVYLRAFVHPPTGSYPAQPVRITFGENGIAAVVSLRDKNNSPNAALEPELLTSILSEQLENRRPVTLDQVPQILQDAVVVTEDVRFWHHRGIDPIGMFRAVFRNIRAGGVAEGASTLTQQLVKNYYLTSLSGERTFRRKLPEIFMAVILDAKYSKREILEAYLNDIYLGRNRSISIMGVGEASHFYFGKPVTDLAVPEAALLAGIIRSPNNYSPFANPGRALERRGTVLGLMLNNRKIDQATYEKAMNTPLPQRPYRDRSGLGSIPFYVDRVLQEMGRDYGITDVKGRGLQIYTAIDFAAQDTAARTLAAGLDSLEKNNRRLRRDDPQKMLQGVLINVDVPSGEIRALVGGRNYDVNQFNRALYSKRLIGSLVKPFVYLTAFEPSLSSQNITPATLVSDTRFVLKRKFSADWSPRNYDDNYHGTVTVQEALEQSLNSASVRIGLASGLDAIIRTMRTLGVTTEVENNPALLLGAAGIPPIEMADAYSTIARTGSRLPLRTIRYVTNDRGKVISAGDDVKPVQVFPARDAFILVNTMKGPIDRGTAYVVRRMGFKKIAAGKTGTTNDKRDAWFIGFTPQTLALTWVGFDDNTPIGLAGGEGAAPIWGRYMLQVANTQPNADFAVPPGVSMVQIDETSGGVATPNFPKNLVVTAAFKSGTEPTIPCPIHSPQQQPMMTTDQFGNPIALDSAQPTSTEGSVTTTDTGPPPDSTLTGGVFKPHPQPATDTSATTSTSTDTSTTTSPPP